MRTIIYFLFLTVQFNVFLALYVPQEYVIPEPKFEIFSSGGFRVSIPDEEGLSLFSFHGNINKIMNGIEAGQLSKDVMKPTDGSWVFEDRNTKLKKGDVISFWVLVVKNNLGYRYDDGLFVVKDIVENKTQADSTQTSIQTHSDDKTEAPKYSDICYEALKLSNTVDQLKGEVTNLKEINDILKNIVAMNEDSSRTLRFEGILPPFDDAEYTAQLILQQKLGIFIRVINAVKESDNSIKFQVASLDDKIYIIRMAKDKLQKINSKIILRY